VKLVTLATPVLLELGGFRSMIFVRMKSFPLAVALILVAFTIARADVRTRTPLAQWQFAEDRSPDNGPYAPPESGWSSVTVPHIFRQSGLPDNTAGWYREVLHPGAADQGRVVYLELEGAASVKDVYLNGQHLGQHRGAFSRCVFDLTPALVFGHDNTLDVRVSNRDAESKNCFSRSTLYYVNGGMFRPAWLVTTGAVHIFPDMGSSGLYLTPTEITPTSAKLNVRAVVRNDLSAQSVTPDIKVRFFVQDPQGKDCASFETHGPLSLGQTKTFEATGTITNPQLWDLAKPNLYTVRTDVLFYGKTMDEVTERTGFRTIAWRDGRFFLNGHEVQFRGVDKHSQNEYDWNAIGDDETRREWQMMADMGVNAVRLAHYPHRALEYAIADERGMAVWAEDGFAGQAWKGAGNEERAVSPDGERLVREMVRQNWNHPSILFWSAGNETLVDVVSHYAALIRQEDFPKLRLVTYAANGKDPANCDFVARNTYDGWYKGHYSQFAELPRNALISETGCGDWITHHVPYGAFTWKVDKYEPEEYAGIFAEFRLQQICRVAPAAHPMFFWWNFREFYDKKFKENRNSKGLVTLAGTPKDLYYLFQSFFNPAKPVVRLCGREFFLRGFAPDNGIKAYSNAPWLDMTLNGAPQERMTNGNYRLPDSMRKEKGKPDVAVPGIPVDNVFFWKTPLQPGKNVIEVRDDKGGSDRMVIYQKAAEGNPPAATSGLVQNVASSKAASPAWFIDRPVEAQGAFYTEVDGTSDNTFDVLPKEVEGASWIATKRLSDAANQTDLSFTVDPQSKGATVFVLFSTGRYPVITLKPVEPAIMAAADVMRQNLAKAGFAVAEHDAVWRDHELNRAEAELWSRSFQPGEKIVIPGQVLDYVVMVKGR
jgi:beta-galactosidase